MLRKLSTLLCYLISISAYAQAPYEILDIKHSPDNEYIDESGQKRPTVDVKILTGDGEVELNVADGTTKEVKRRVKEQIESTHFISQEGKYTKEVNIVEPHLHKGAMGLTSEMAKFYLAIGALDVMKAFRSGDPTYIQAFMDSLKNPTTYLGFTLFSITSKLTTEYSLILSQKAIPISIARHMGLAAGMMVDSIFQEIVYHPETKNLLASWDIKDPAKRKESRNKAIKAIWGDTLGNPEWRGDKIPEVMALIGTAIVVPAGIGATKKVMDASARKIFFKMGTNSKLVARGYFKYRRFSKQWTMARQGFRVLWKGSRITRINPVIFIGTQIIETMIFIHGAEWVTEPLTRFVKNRRGADKIYSSREKLKKALDFDQGFEVVEPLVEELSTEYQNFRETLFLKPMQTFSRHIGFIQKVDSEYTKFAYFYSYLIDGTTDQEFWDQNVGEWHPKGDIKEILEKEKFIEKLFCGKHVDSALKMSLMFHGVPIPFYRAKIKDYGDVQNWTETLSISISPFRVHRLKGACTSDIETIRLRWINNNYYRKVMCPVKKQINGEYKLEEYQTTYAACQIQQQRYRHYVLENSRVARGDLRYNWSPEQFKIFLESTAETVLGILMKQSSYAKEEHVRRYYESVQLEILGALSGQKAVVATSGEVSYRGRQKYVNVMRNDPNWNYENMIDRKYATIPQVVVASYPRSIIKMVDIELDFWLDLADKYPKYEELFIYFYEGTEEALAYANGLKGFNELDIKKRKYTATFAEMFGETNWTEAAKFFQGFVIQ